MVRSCDEKLPQCSQCQRMRRPCPGPLTGTIFVHAVATDRGPKAEKAKKIQIATTHQEFPIVAATVRQFQHARMPLAEFPNIYQPSVAPAFDQLFLSTFIDSFAKPSAGSDPHQSWMKHLHEFLVTGDAPIKHSIRAAATAYHGRVAQNAAAQRAAEHCYIAALRTQRARITPYLNCSASHYVPDDQEIFTSMMLLYFELICPSSTASWLKHLHGVTSLLQLRGAESCQVGGMHLLFRSLRFLEAYSSFRKRRPSVFASEAWRTIPFAISGKSDTDRLVDILLLAPNLFNDMGFDDNHFLDTSSAVSIEGLSAELSVYKERYINSILLAHEANRNMDESPDDDEADDCNECTAWIDGGGDFCTAMPESLFYSARILVDHVTFRGNMKSCEEHRIAEQLIYASLLFRIAEVSQVEASVLPRGCWIL
ncbi:uncharacterized protein TRIVIDRAFT_205899 [Trichoderma virens Gv29-8]|uniref:Zn(2)-C6 fungal-type domain-containing protein n=1 Tax=Hypocrea virens (strain Gv29-8 / FGSC 10586) TaxID=413071 RepID=G9N8J5_HYPVG|nr:uncharacterized protein TRIVIDRAFT_205899 [Trichoderma virens Gv29-8]EHK17301.1 hypothetical protein TRIVIDRAFT_205899 [Trichoderma virens Gv29-8]